VIPQLANRVLWCDLVSGEMFHIDADRLPTGGQDALRRVLLNDGGTAKTFLQIVREKRVAQGQSPAGRADLRIFAGPNDEVFLLNKADGVIRMLTR
jgi:hypothetical protein